MSVNAGIISAPIDTSDPYSAMGLGATSSGYDVGYACENSHGRINKFSLIKPVRFNKIFELTEVEFKSVNYGYDIKRYENYLDFVIGLRNGFDWGYLPPRATDWKRITDFEGYEQFAESPFQLSISNRDVPQGSQCNVTFPTNLTDFTTWKEWASYTGVNIKYLNAAFYVPNVGVFTLTDTDQGFTINDLDESKLFFTTPSDRFNIGESYEIYLIFTTWDGRNGQRQWYIPSETEGGIWWCMPSFATFTVTKPYSPTDDIRMTITNERIETAVDQDGDSGFKNIYFNYVFRMPDYQGIKGKLSVDFYVNNAKLYTGLNNMNVGKVSLHTASQADFTNKSSLAGVVDYKKGVFFITGQKEERLIVNVEMRFSVNTTTKVATDSFEIWA